MNQLGQQLKQLRQAKCLTTRGAARALEISPSRLGDFERGTSHVGKYPAVPSRDLLVKMADLYGFPVATLLALAGLPEAEPDSPPRPSEIELGVAELGQIYRDLPERDRRVLLRQARVYREEVLGGSGGE